MTAVLDNERGSEPQAAVSRPQVMRLNSDFLSLTLFYNRKSEACNFLSNFFTLMLRC